LAWINLRSDKMLSTNRLLEYLEKMLPRSHWAESPDGAVINAVKFPVAALETHGAILFADLPEFSKLADEEDSAVCTYVTNHFFAWFEGEAGRHFGGIVDKFIGDEVMVVFPHTECKEPPLQAAMHTAHAMLKNDPYNFRPKIGIAEGQFVVAVVGTEQSMTASAIGNTVNLAARCTGRSEEESHDVRIAIDKVDIVKKVFKDDCLWEINPPKTFQPKNMSSIEVVDVRRTSENMTMFDYFQNVREYVKSARDQGAIRGDG